ncbi:MAG: hypothetical protein AB8B69_02500 [Chitinophagales bacterium]
MKIAFHLIAFLLFSNIVFCQDSCDEISLCIFEAIKSKEVTNLSLYIMPIDMQLEILKYKDTQENRDFLSTISDSMTNIIQSNIIDVNREFFKNELNIANAIYSRCDIDKSNLLTFFFQINNEEFWIKTKLINGFIFDKIISQFQQANEVKKSIVVEKTGEVNLYFNEDLPAEIKEIIKSCYGNYGIEKYGSFEKLNIIKYDTMQTVKGLHIVLVASNAREWKTVVFSIYPETGECKLVE